MSRWVRVTRRDDRTVIVMRARPWWPTAVLSCVLVVGMAGLGWQLLGMLAADRAATYHYSGHRATEVGLDLTLIAVTAAVAFLAARWGWRAVLSRDVVSLTDAMLTVRSGALLLTAAEPFGAQWMRRLRAVPEALVLQGHAGANPWRFVAGRNIAFDYGPRTVRTGLRLTEADANEAVAAIRERIAPPDSPFRYGVSSLEASGPADDALAPPPPRAHVEDDGRRLHIVVPARRQYLFAGICAVILACAVWFALAASSDRALSVDLVPTFVGAAVMFFVAARRALWDLFGAEEISLLPDSLQIAHLGGLLPSRSAFGLHHLAGCEASIIPGPPGVPDSTLRKGNVCCHFQEEERTGEIRFGLELEEAEAEALAHLLEERVEALRSGAS